MGDSNSARSEGGKLNNLKRVQTARGRQFKFENSEDFWTQFAATGATEETWQRALAEGFRPIILDADKTTSEPLNSFKQGWADADGYVPRRNIGIRLGGPSHLTGVRVNAFGKIKMAMQLRGFFAAQRMRICNASLSEFTALFHSSPDGSRNERRTYIKPATGVATVQIVIDGYIAAYGWNRTSGCFYGWGATTRFENGDDVTG